MARRKRRAMKSIVQVSPLLTSRSIRAQPVRLQTKSSMVAVASGCDYLGDISAGTSVVDGDILMTYLMNPSRVPSRLAQIASTYERFKYLALTLHYVPMVPATTAGTLVGMLELDPDDIVSSSANNVRDFINSLNNFSTQVAIPITYRCALDKTVPYLYCENTNSAAVVDLRSSLQGYIAVCWHGSPPPNTTTFGSMYAEYTIEFRDPQFSPTLAPSQEPIKSKTTTTPIAGTFSSGVTAGTVISEFNILDHVRPGDKFLGKVVEAVETGFGVKNGIKLDRGNFLSGIFNVTNGWNIGAAYTDVTKTPIVSSEAPSIWAIPYVAVYVVPESHIMTTQNWPYVNHFGMPNLPCYAADNFASPYFAYLKTEKVDGTGLVACEVEGCWTNLPASPNELTAKCAPQILCCGTTPSTINDYTSQYCTSLGASVHIDNHTWYTVYSNEGKMYYGTVQEGSMPVYVFPVVGLMFASGAGYTPHCALTLQTLQDCPIAPSLLPVSACDGTRISPETDAGPADGRPTLLRGSLDALLKKA